MEDYQQQQQILQTMNSQQQTQQQDFKLNASQLIEQLKSGQLTKDQLMHRISQGSRQSVDQFVAFESGRPSAGNDLKISQYQPQAQYDRSSTCSVIDQSDFIKGSKRQSNEDERIIQLRVVPSEATFENKHEPLQALKSIENFQSFQNKRPSNKQSTDIMNSKEKKLYQMPLQFSDKFFDEDPGLIKIVENDSNQDQENDFLNVVSNFTRQSVDYMGTQHQLQNTMTQYAFPQSLLQSQRDNRPISSLSEGQPQVSANHNPVGSIGTAAPETNPDYSKDIDQNEILRKAGELTRAIDNQYSYLLSSRRETNGVGNCGDQTNYPGGSIAYDYDKGSIVGGPTINMNEEKYQFASIFNSPQAHNHTINIYEQNTVASEEAVVRANAAIYDQFPYSNFQSNVGSKTNLNNINGFNETFPVEINQNQSNYYNMNPKNLYQIEEQFYQQHLQQQQQYNMNNYELEQSQGISRIIAQQNNCYNNQSQNLRSSNFNHEQSYEIINDTKNFSERNNKWVNQHNQRKNQIQQQVKEQQEKECTFRPQTNNKSSKIAKQKQIPNTDRNEQLYYQKGKKQQETVNRLQREQEEQMARQCTFRPQIIDPQSTNAIIGSRCMQIAEDLIHNKIHVHDFYNTGLEQFKREENEFRECTFAPQINGIKRNMQTAQLYTSINAFERLSKPLSQLMPQIESSLNQDEYSQNCNGDLNCIQEESDEMEKIQEQLQSFGQHLNNFGQFQNPQNQAAIRAFTNCGNLSSIISQSHLQSRSTNEVVQSLLERQNKFLQDKEEHLKQIKEQASFTHAPKINEISKDMIKSDFDQRNQILLQKRSQYQNSELSQHNELKECSFQPKITKLGQNIKPKDIVELSYGDMQRKQQVIDNVISQVEQEMKDKLTFKPQFIAAEKNPDIQEVKSKLNLQNGLDQLLERINMEKTQKETEQEQIKKLREEMEMIECTYRPQTSQLPEYIKLIADESKKIKEQRAAIEAQLPPQKPEWKT